MDMDCCAPGCFFAYVVVFLYNVGINNYLLKAIVFSRLRPGNFDWGTILHRRRHV